MNSIYRASRPLLLALQVAFLVFLTACQTSKNAGIAPSEENASPDNSIVLREGDAIQVSFPGAKQLDAAQLIRRDGKIVIPTFGEVQAAGLSPSQLEKKIVESFGEQLLTKEVTVTLASSQYPLFINGAVLRPGKVEATRPITVLEAIMEAGGFDYARANVKSVKIIRTTGTEIKTYVVDLRGILKGEKSQPFYVRPSDIIFVPERFTLF